jgi:hypothetical protein
MKKVLVALFTFLLGIFAFNLLDVEKIAAPEPFAPTQKAIEIPKAQIEELTNQKLVNSEPFFNSFSEDEGYGGWFMVDNFKGMKEVWTILLSRDNENFEESEKLVWSAMILTLNADDTSNDDDNFQSVWLKTESNRLSFRTNKIRGIEYKFDGRFFKNGKDFSSDEKVLKGTLRKIVKGKEVAKLATDFAYQEPHCFH